MSNQRKLRVSFTSLLPLKLTLIVSPDFQAWTVSRPTVPWAHETLDWSLWRHDGVRWLIRFRPEMEIMHSEEGVGVFLNEEVRLRSFATDDGWELPLVGASMTHIKTEGFSLHCSLATEDEDALPQRVLLADSAPSLQGRTGQRPIHHNEY